MILWTGKAHPFDSEPWVVTNARRWTFVAERWHMGFVEELRWKSDGQWSGCGYYAGAWLATGWCGFGFERLWYDGPHALLNLGLLQLGWSLESTTCD